MTFDAAATFFHLVNIWGTPDHETQQKIKYAKWNAARIAKALKEGKDPNESNPKPQEVEEQPELDPNDPEVKMLGGSSSVGAPRPVSVEDVPDADIRRDAAGVSLPHSPASAGPSPMSDGELRLPGVPTKLGPPAGTQPGYFDSETIPSPVSPPATDFRSAPDLPSAPSGWGGADDVPDIPSAPTGWSNPPPPSSGWPPSQPPFQPPTAPSGMPPTFAPSPRTTAAVASPPVRPPTDSYYTNVPPTTHTARPVAPPVALPTAYGQAPATVDEAAMVAAQKHAKWAISALNFEDVNTAVRELRKALEMLGAP